MTLNAVLEEVLRRLDAQEALLRDHAARAEARSEALAEAVAEIRAGRQAPPGQEAFQETLGLTLAEFLARLETQTAPAGPRLLS